MQYSIFEVPKSDSYQKPAAFCQASYPNPCFQYTDLLSAASRCTLRLFALLHDLFKQACLPVLFQHAELIVSLASLIFLPATLAETSVYSLHRSTAVALIATPMFSFPCYGSASSTTVFSLW